MAAGTIVTTGVQVQVLYVSQLKPRSTYWVLVLKSTAEPCL